MCRVLLVDDQPHILRVVKMALGGKGYAVDVASDGLMAFEKLQQTSYDVLITDQQMPRMCGTELCERLRAELPPPHPYVLLVTASTAADLREWVERQGSVELLEKPISLRHLRQRLDAVFASTDATDRAQRA